MRREQDSTNPRTKHQDIMVLAHEDASCEGYHPYWYTRVVKIFHADVYHIGEKSTMDEPYKMDFLWVCWFSLDESHRVDGRPDGFIKLAFSTVKMSGHVKIAVRTSSLHVAALYHQSPQDDIEMSTMPYNVYVV